MSSERRQPDLSEQQVNRLLRSYLREEWHEDANRVASSVLDELDTTPQRRAGWLAWRSSVMNNNIVRVGLAAAAVVVIAIIAINLLPGSAPPGGEPSVSPSVEPSEAAPSVAESTGDGSLPEGPYVLFPESNITTVTIPGPGWFGLPQFGAIALDNNADPPSGTGLIGEFTGEALHVSTDGCNWESTLPDGPAATVDELLAALASQASRDASAPEDITMGGLPGRKITLHVPIDAVFADCDQDQFCTLSDGITCHRSHQGEGLGQIDEFWIVDVDGHVMVMDGMYGPETPQEDIDELYTILESATFSP
jgi:hypothetical protein